MCWKSHWISETKLFWWKNEQLVRFGAKFNFYFFPDHSTLIFLKMKCNPTNKKTVAYSFAGDVAIANINTQCETNSLLLRINFWHPQRTSSKDTTIDLNGTNHIKLWQTRKRKNCWRKHNHAMGPYTSVIKPFGTLNCRIWFIVDNRKLCICRFQKPSRIW